MTTLRNMLIMGNEHYYNGCAYYNRLKNSPSFNTFPFAYYIPGEFKRHQGSYLATSENDCKNKIDLIIQGMK